MSIATLRNALILLVLSMPAVAQDWDRDRHEVFPICKAWGDCNAHERLRFTLPRLRPCDEPLLYYREIPRRYRAYDYLDADDLLPYALPGWYELDRRPSRIRRPSPYWWR